MEPDKNKEPEKKEEAPKGMTDKLIEKAEDWMEETAEKIHKSDTYHKIDQSMEKATKSLFRKAGRWWGKL